MSSPWMHLPPSWMRLPGQARRRRRLLLIGEGSVADACARALQGGDDRLTRARDLESSGLALSRVDVLLLAGLDAPLLLLEQLAVWLEQAGRHRPSRVLLIDEGGAPEAEALAEARKHWPDEVQFEQISIPTAAARRLLACWPLHWGADPCFAQPIHLVILGRGRFADALLVQALRISGYGAQRSHFTLLSESPRDWERAFRNAYPQAHEIAEVRFGGWDGANRSDAADGADRADGADGANMTDFTVLLDPAEAPPVTAAVVCALAAVESASASASASGSKSALASAARPRSGPGGAPGLPPFIQACELAKRLLELQRCSPPILVEIGDEVTAAGELSDWDGQLMPFSHRRLVLDRAVLLDGRGDELAQVIHDHYRDTTEAQGRDPALEPAGRPWSTLASSYRDANRHQADHLWAKLALTDCQAVPEDQVESFAFAPVEVERLAVIEHGRWAADRWLDGWSYAPTRDNTRKHHPQLIPYQQLSGPMKDLDRFAVRLVPTLLARSGLGVLRMLLIGLAPTMAAQGAEGDQDQADDGINPIPPGSRLTRLTRLTRLMRRALVRLAARYPDRSLIIATSLDDPAHRQFVKMAIEEQGAGFFLLLPRPLPHLLDALNATARLQVLNLVARAERRITLREPGDLKRWLDQRAEILVEVGDGVGDEVGDSVGGEVGEWEVKENATHRKRLRIRPTPGLEWNFEY